MTDSTFVHLHTHTQYSLLEATCKVDDLAQLAVKYKMPAIAFTDYGNMFGAIESYFACKKKEINPILGIEIFITEDRFAKGDHLRVPLRHLVLLAKNFKGYQQLCQINTKGQLEGFYYRPRVDMTVLKELSTDLICLTGGLRGIIPAIFLEQGSQSALKEISNLKEIYKENLFLEMQKPSISQWDSINDFLLEASKQLDVPVVATNDVHFTHKEDSIAQDVLNCIRTNTIIQDPSRHKMESDEYYFKSPDEMQTLFKDIPQALSNTLEIARQCQVEFQLKDTKGQPIYHLPGYNIDNDRNILEEITFQAEQGLQTRFVQAEQNKEPVLDKDKYYKRLKHELEIIHSMGFSGYFLIVQDFIKYARTQNIPVGPGRGSGAGSLVAYSLTITDLDPIKYNLIFERFLNPERISMPDFDIDFCQDRRQEVIEYVTNKYGKASVSQIITFGRLQARAAVRDVGRVLGMTFAQVNVIAQLIPDTLGITLDAAIKQEARLQELIDSDPKAMQVLELARKIEGLHRHASIHPAGVVISDQSLVNLAPLYRGKEGENVIQFDMKSAEKIGLIKFDFLGLRTLTHIDKTLKLIAQNKGKNISLNQISLSDKGIYELMSSGDTSGVFQFESAGITDLICKFRPKSFEDITAINALYRPGPMQMLDEFIARKHGQSKIQYLFKELEPILKETYGIIVYQEQVQLIAARIANYSLGEADILRRAMGKKNVQEMAQQKARFLKGAVEENKYPLKKAEELFLLMAKFAEYGFNKSHAAAYCVVAAQTAWFKFYYPHEFYTALLSVEMSHIKKLLKYLKDVQTKGLDLEAPHVNFSEYEFSIQGEKIFFGLGAIKGVGQGVVDSIIATRKSKKQFKDVKDFFDSVDAKVLNKKTIECLIQAGALDNLGASRRQIWESYDKLIALSEERRRDQEIGQINLFQDSKQQQQSYFLADVKPWSQRERLKREKSVLGFFLSDHPVEAFQNLLDQITSCHISRLSDKFHKKKVTVGGLITSLRERLTKKGTLMAFATLEDSTDEVDLIIFSDCYSKTKVIKDEVYIATGILEKEEDVTKIIVEQLESLEDKIKHFKEICILIKESEQDKLEELQALLKKHKGQTQVKIKLQTSQGYLVNFSIAYSVLPTRQWIDDLYDLFKRRDIWASHIF